MLTVEEARKQITDLVIAATHDRSYSGLPLDICLDDLILAVQAAMPCYRDGGPMCSCWIGGTFVIDQCGSPCGHCGKTLELCPSCTARRTLREREAVQA